MATAQAVPEKDTLLDALRDLIAQRPNIEPGNYISGWNDTEGRRAYNAERREVSAQRADALTLINAVEAKAKVTADDMLQALPSRLVWDAERGAFDYLVGQYWATEYRRAVASYCASVLWAYYRDRCCADSAEKVRQAARREFRPRRLLGYFR